MPIHIVFDFESYYDREFSLSKMTPVEYVLDPRFEVTGCAVKVDDRPSLFLTPAQLRVLLARLDPRQVVAISHNALFDMLILAWHFDFTPGLMVDTLGMARALVFYETGSVALKSVARHLGLGEKGDTIHNVIGMNAAAIRAAGLWSSYAAYAVQDAELCRAIFDKLKRHLPASEYAVMDTIIRCAITPAFEIDATLLAEHLQAIQATKEGLLDRIGVTKDDLMSNPKFAAALERLGVDPPTKVSAATGKETWAFAKSDLGFIELQDHPDPDVQALVAARLGHKSTMEETRTERFLAISRVTWRGYLAGRPWMPVALRYAGAHTHRFSGDWKLNQQNLPSRKGTKALRRSLKAPAGMVVVAVDASQIEARLNAWLNGQDDLVQLFADRGDPYIAFAERVYRRRLTKKNNPVERFVGKTAVLGLGYGMGPPKFLHTIKVQAADQGIDIAADDAMAADVVKTYRTTNHHIAAGWRTLGDIIPLMAREASLTTFGPDGVIVFAKEHLIGPNGLRIHYRNLRYEPDGWVYEFGKQTKRLYGGKVLENICQFLARIIITDAGTRIRRRTGHLWKLQVHDELVFVVPEQEAESFLQVAIEEMRRRPDWAPGLPLDAEGAIGPNYGETK